MPAENWAAAAGVLRNVRLPTLKSSGPTPVLVNWVGTAVVPGDNVSAPYVWNSATLPRLPAPTVTDPLPWLVNPLSVAGAGSPAAMFSVLPLVILRNVA